jgi:predicted dehydrogenase
VDAVLVATADFQHAQHGVEAVKRGAMRTWRSRRRTPWTMRGSFCAAVKKTGKIVQVGTQRRSTPSYMKAAEYIKSGSLATL